MCVSGCVIVNSVLHVRVLWGGGEGGEKVWNLLVSEKKKRCRWCHIRRTSIRGDDLDKSEATGVFPPDGAPHTFNAPGK